ncbi:MAG: sigma-70 family RNA polymerase sigma factor, partial [Tidjanibacter sp.]|nr:sigma-70 family RNA polymerase sigma factor [Tidjanibacter sp.]
MTDSQIIAHILERGEVQLFSLIVGRYSAEVFRAAMATAHNTSIAEEATQQAFIKAYENLHRWRGGLSIAPYLK